MLQAGLLDESDTTNGGASMSRMLGLAKPEFPIIVAGDHGNVVHSIDDVRPGSHVVHSVDGL
jgi:hypothetical protein